MREFTSPPVVDLSEQDDLTAAVFANAADHPDDVAFAHKADGRWTDVTCREFAAEVTALAKGLVAAGVQPGDRIALMSATRYEWTLVDYAIWTAGAVTVPVYETSSADQIEWILSDSEAVAVFLETDAHVAAYREVADRLPAVRHCWRLGSLGDVVTGGRDVPDDEIARRREGLGPDSLATVIYTSGTTGRPKGCELTHRNFLFDALATTETLDELFGPDQSTLLFLPLAHVFARLIQVGSVVKRVRMGHTSDIKNLLADLGQFQPTFVLSVPRVFEKVYTQASRTAHADSAVRGRVFDLAERTAIAYSEALDAGGPGPLLRARHALFDRLVYARLRAALGGRVTAAVSGGAPLGARLGHFFRGAGVPVYEGYGLTETTAAATVNLPSAMKVGTVGRPVPGVSVRIAEDGEILLRGDNVFRGYWRNEQATKETLEPDGWFHTGDVGELDADGFLRITGRKKELIVTAGGKNVAPAVLEDRLRAHPLVSQVMVVGDQKPFIGALITLDDETLPAWLADHGRPEDTKAADLVDDPELQAELRAAVADTNRAVSKAESIRAFRVLPEDFSVEGGEVTPTLKLKRNVVLDRYGDEVDALYSGGGVSV